MKITVPIKTMAIAWSKTVPYTCYELGHCWTPHCSQAFTDIAIDAFKYALKVYGTLYLLAAIIRRKKKSYYLKKLIPETIRSSVFLSTNGCLFIGAFCLWRKIFPFYTYYNGFLVGIPITVLVYHLERGDRAIMGQSTYPTSGFAPSACASFLAILLERKARRGILALYLLNLATETAYNSALSHGVVPYIKNGETGSSSDPYDVMSYFDP
ncbi:hypothetical protein LSH36_858g00055 [Paralvinella palmiformis]|uniref:Transmembrane protein 135 N-terminal domain-containing protein n=1 Tax=Paralvinella palmiformis TaxID=53620 RepID=A0AAD9MUA7_9ANNE|nr:hypothetical protein LSH36_858g00055 [Paralvinella palmiformis]